MKRHIQIGDRFGKLTVVAKGRKKANYRYYVVQCECGSALKEVVGTSLLTGLTRSCGCLSKEHMRKVGKANRKYEHCLMCENPIVWNHGLCYTHFLQWQRGDVTAEQNEYIISQQKNSPLRKKAV